MKTSILYKTDKGQEAIRLMFSIVGEFWFDNSHYLIIAPYTCPVEYKLDRALVFPENPYYTVFDKLNINSKNYLVVRPKAAFKNVVINPPELLSQRELQVVELVALGKSNKQIAKKLKISEHTVSTHLRRIFIKLEVDNRAAMVYYCASMIRYQM